MTQIRLGKTEIITNKNGFGALPIQRISYEEADALIMKAYEAGITFFDTARFYTDSEAKLGKALSERGLRQKVSQSRFLSKTWRWHRALRGNVGG